MRYVLQAVSAAACIVAIGGFAGTAHAGVRIMDIIEIEGANSNQLMGVGLVVGLNGTGGKITTTQRMAIDMLQRYGIGTNFQSDFKGDTVFKTGNISVVVVTANLGPFSRTSSQIDVTVSALDDAISLQGGTLLRTPLKGIDGVDYALAQGSLSASGFVYTATGGPGTGTAASAQKNHPTVGRIPNGALVVNEARAKILCNGAIKLLLRPDSVDYNTSRAIAKAINERHPGCAFAADAGTVSVFPPPEQCMNLVAFIGEIGKLEVTPDTPARVVINSRTGTIVAGHNVKVATVALTHGNLAIVVNNEPVASQPNSFSRGKTVILNRAQLGVTEQPNTMQVIEQTVTVGDLARALNALGAAPRDLIAIFEALDRAGALHAKLVEM
jgi:flagellar P-ring protein precursor FlgI